MEISEKERRNVIKFTEKNVKEYLDSCIVIWRDKRDNMENSKEERLMAVYYIDAYQSVRMSLFNEQKEAAKRIFSKG